MYRVIAILSLPFVLSGCAAVAVGGLIYHDSKSREQRQAFNQQFQQTNLERAKLGLPPLDYCTEAVRSDQTWAADLPECKAAPGRSTPAGTPAPPEPTLTPQQTVNCISEGGQKLQLVGTQCPEHFKPAS